MFNSLLGLVFYITLARALGVSAFGYLSFLLGLGLLAAELGDLGFGSAVIKFGSGTDFPAVFSLATLQRILVILLIGVIFIIASFYLDPNLIYAAPVGATLLLVSLVTQGLIARQRYGFFVGVNVLGNAVRLILLFWLVTAGLLTAVTGLVVFCLANLAAFICGFGVLVYLYRSKLITTNISAVKTPVWKYVRFLAVSFGLTSLSAKIDMPVVFVLAGPVATGVYSSAQKLASVFQQIAVAIEGVFAPKLSGLENSKHHFRDYLTVVVLVILGVLILIPVSPILVPIIFGSGYVQAVGVFQVLLIATALFFASGPFTAAVLYKHGMAKYHLVVTAVTLGATLTAYFILIPPLGAVGAGLVFVINALVNLLGFVIVWKKLE